MLQILAEILHLDDKKAEQMNCEPGVRTKTWTHIGL